MIHIAELVRRWDVEQSRILPPARSSEVLAAFESIGQKATADVVALYECCGGMEVMDNAYWRLWPLKEFIQENADVGEFGPKFGDYLIDSWGYRLRPLNEEVSAVYVDYFDGNDPAQVTSSLHEFLDGLWRDPFEILERQLWRKVPREP